MFGLRLGSGDLGVSDKLIDTIDPDGVALAAIQGLHVLVEENEMRLAPEGRGDR